MGLSVRFVEASLRRAGRFLVSGGSVISVSRRMKTSFHYIHLTARLTSEAASRDGHTDMPTRSCSFAERSGAERRRSLVRKPTRTVVQLQCVINVWTCAPQGSFVSSFPPAPSGGLSHDVLCLARVLSWIVNSDGHRDQQTDRRRADISPLPRIPSSLPHSTDWKSSRSVQANNLLFPGNTLIHTYIRCNIYSSCQSAEAHSISAVSARVAASFHVVASFRN